MELKAGWNSEYGREKFDVLFQEIDFILLLRDNGIDPDLGIKALMSEKFQLMYLEVELLATVAKAKFYEKEAIAAGRDPARDTNLSATLAQHAALTKGKEDSLAALKKRLGIDDGDGPAAAQS